MTTTQSRHPLGAQGGFTLVELLVSMVVLGIFIAAFSVTVGSTIRHSSVVQEQTALQAEARAAADTLVRDLRQASSGVSGTCPITLATPTAISFYSPDSQQPSHQRTVAVQLVNGQLQRAVSISTNTSAPWTGMWSTPPANAWATHLGSVTSSSIFSYYDASGTAIAAPVASSSLASIKMVGIGLSTSAKGSGGQESAYQTRATLRVTSC